MVWHRPQPTTPVKIALPRATAAASVDELGVGVAVRGIAVAVGSGTVGVAFGGTGVAVGGTTVAVGGVKVGVGNAVVDDAADVPALDTVAVVAAVVVVETDELLSLVEVAVV